MLISNAQIMKFGKKFVDSRRVNKVYGAVVRYYTLPMARLTDWGVEKLHKLGVGDPVEGKEVQRFFFDMHNQAMDISLAEKPFRYAFEKAYRGDVLNRYLGI